MSAYIEGLNIPYLEELTFNSVRRFIACYRAYVARAGGATRSVRRMADLLSPRVLAVLKLQNSDFAMATVSTEELVAAFGALFAARSIDACADRLAGLRMQGKPGIESLARFVGDFQDVLMFVLASARPGERSLVKLFEAGLKPARLQEMVARRRPATLDEACSIALNCQQSLEAARELQGAGSMSDTPTVGGRTVTGDTRRDPSGRLSAQSIKSTFVAPTSATVKGHGVAVKREPGTGSRTPVTAVQQCFYCKKPGHMRRDCPVLAARGNSMSSKAHVRALALAESSGIDDLAAADGGALPDGMVRAMCMQPPPSLATALLLDSDLPVPKSVDTSAPLRDAAMPAVRSYLRGMIKPIGKPLAEPIKVDILMDMGSTLSTVSPAVAAQLEQLGAKLRPTNCKVRAPGNTHLSIDKEVDCMLTIADPLLTKCETAITFHVLETGSPVLLSAPMLRTLGLMDVIPLLAQETQPSSQETETDLLDIPLGLDHVGHETSREQTSLGAVHVAAGPIHDSLVSLVTDYADVFSGELHPEGADTLPMRIDLMPDAYPKSAPPRRQSEAIRKLVSEEVKKMLNAGLIRPSVSSVTSPVVMVRQKDKYRFCVDYTLVNQCTIPLRFPLPNLLATLQRLVGKVLYATLDLKSGYHQVRMHPDAIPLTAFTTMDGLYEYVVVPFGLKNAPAFFQFMMQDILTDFIGISCEVYIDDIIVYGETPEKFYANLRRILERLRSRRLRLRGDKCHIGLAEVEYLGHVVNGDGIRMSTRRKEALTRIVQPTSTATVRSFFGFANYFRAFVQNFALVTKPLTRLCSPKVKFKWTDDCQEAFLKIKKAIMESAMLYHIRYDMPVILRTDASTLGLGAMLLNLDTNGNVRPIWYLSRAFTPAESRWSTLEQEAFAIFYAITSLSHFLLGHDFVVETDHRNLMYIYKAKSPKVERWKLRLQEYAFTI